MFKTDRSLLNPKFEGYKLDPLEQEDHVSFYSLPCAVSQSKVSSSTRSRTHIPFEEMRSRIRHNFLAIGANEEALYLDEEMGVNVVRMQGEIPTLTRVCELPTSIQTESASVQHEDPSAISITEESWLISDGSGNIHLLVKKPMEDLKYEIQNTYAFKPAESVQGAYPHTLRAAKLRNEDVLVLVSYKPATELDMRKKTDATLYQLHALSIPLSKSQITQEYLSPIWTIYGRDLPLSVGYHASHAAFLVLASAEYGALTKQPAPYTPKPDEIVPVPQPVENMNEFKPPPYSWTQTSESVTVAFPLPAGISTREIHVQMARKVITVLVKPSQFVDASLILPRYALKELWGEIKVTESLWTWDKDDAHAYGLLTLHLEKGHEGTRWPHVFHSEDVEVAETVDPSELANIRDLLEKYTSGQDDLGLGRGVPSLAEGEMDEEVDDNVGRSIIPIWVTEGGDILGTARDRTPLNVLSTPLPGSEKTPPSSTIIVKQAVDGLLLTSSPADPESVPTWTHTATWSALGFVLASKRDVKFTFHTPSAVLAFESGASGNVYIYRQTAKAQDCWAKQAILKVSGGSAGALLGAGIIRSGSKTYILALCEREIRVIRNAI